MSHLDALREVVTVGEPTHEYVKGSFDVLYTDYPLTVSRAGRTYLVGTATVYPDGEVLLLRSASNENVTKYRAWSHCIWSLGYRPPAGLHFRGNPRDAVGAGMVMYNTRETL